MEKLSLKDGWDLQLEDRRKVVPVGREILQRIPVELEEYPQRCEWMHLDTRLMWAGTMRSRWTGVMGAMIFRAKSQMSPVGS